MINFTVYALRDPQTKEIRYIGCSINVLQRYREHLRDRKKTHKANWIAKLSRDGYRPELVILKKDLGSAEEMKAEEIRFIEEARAAGQPLTNITAGGESKFGYTTSEETKAKISKALSGRSRPDLSLKRKGVPNPKLSEALRGRPLSEAHKKKLSDLSRGKKQDPAFAARRTSMNRKVLVCSDGRTFLGAKEAAQNLGIKVSDIKNHLRGCGVRALGNLTLRVSDE